MDLFRKLSDRRILVKYILIYSKEISMYLLVYYLSYFVNPAERELRPSQNRSQTHAGYLVQLFRNLFYQKEMKARSEALKTLEIKIKYCLFAL